MKKKGFTLIELLAVIVILAIIALIITPLISDLIESSRYAAAVDSALAYVAGANNQVATDVGIGGFEDFSLHLPEEKELETDITDEELSKIKYKGKGPTYVYLKFNDGGTYVEEAHFCIWGYSIDYNPDNGASKSDISYCGETEPDGVPSCDILNNNSYDDNDVFKVNNVEDLVCISELAKTKTFENKTIYLIKDVDFNSDSSYVDPNNKTYGDINGNGETEGLKTELTTGKGFYPIGSSPVPFKGTFEGYTKGISNLMINRSQDDVGLFGYNQGKIQGFTLSTNVTGNNNVGGLVGYNDGGIINEIITGNTTIRCNKNGGGLVGYSNGGDVTSVLVKNVDLQGGASGGIIGVGPNMTLTGVIEAGNVVGTYSNKVSGRGTYGTITAYVTSALKLSSSGGGGDTGTLYVLNDEILNAYDKVLDTYIGGDNDESGYYFDYEKEDNSNIVIKRTTKNPIKFTVQGNGTNEKPYIVDNAQHYKELSILAGDGNSYKFKFTKDIDFTGRHYYALGTNGNSFNADIDGDLHTVSNVSFACAENCGLINQNDNHVIEGLNIENVTITSGNDNVGGLVGNNSGTVKGINASNITVTGPNNVGGVVGYNDGGTVNEIIASTMVVRGDRNSGGVVGYSNGGETKSILVKSVDIQGTPSGGIVGVAPNVVLSGVVESGNIVGTYSGKVNGRGTSGTITVYSASTVQLSSSGGGGNNGLSYVLNDEMLNVYDGALDTYIGGDNDESDYYFDYENDSSSNIVIKRTKDVPITFTLNGNGTLGNPFIIDSYQHYKEATTILTDIENNYKFKFTADIDFAGKHYYSLGTVGNPLAGDIDGNMRTISNISFGCAENCGLINQNDNHVIEGLNIENVTITSGNDNVGGLVGNNSGIIKGINASNITVTGFNNIGGIVGYNTGEINEITFTGNINGKNNVGGIVGYSEGGEIKSILAKNANPKGYYSGGIVGRGPNVTVTGAFEQGISDGTYGGKIGARYTNGNINAYASSLSTLYNYGGNGGVNGTSYTLVLPTTVTVSGEEIDSLTYYDNVGILDTIIGGDNDDSGYYLQYNNSADSIIVVKAGTSGGVVNPGGSSSSSPVPIIGESVGTNPPTCVLNEVIPRSNGIQAVLTCEDEEGAPTIRSQWNVNKNAVTNQFSDIGIIKNGSVNGNSKTVRPYWSTSDPISVPHRGDCYYYRFGAMDASGNYSYYVTENCYHAFTD